MEERAAIGDKRIIALYEKGLSQNDIKAICKVSLPRIRSVLKDANFDTRGYRTLNEWQKRIIVSLVRSGVRYLDIERVTDISIHAIRDYIGRIPRLSDRSTRPPRSIDSAQDAFPNKNDLIRQFKSGTSFSRLVARYDLHERHILHFYHSISKEVLSEHRKALKDLIVHDLESGLSVSNVARKHWVSRAVVKKISAN